MNEKKGVGKVVKDMMRGSLWGFFLAIGWTFAGPILPLFLKAYPLVTTLVPLTAAFFGLTSGISELSKPPDKF